MRWKRTTAFTVAILLCLVAVSWGDDPGVFRLRDPGEHLPAISLLDTAGGAHSLDPQGLDRPVLLYFWSVYCPNCKEAMPGLISLYTDAADRQADVWAINVDGDRFSNAVRAYVQDVELPFPVLYDRLEGEYLVAADPLGVSKTPTLYLAGRDGKIALRQVIEMDFGAVRTALQTLSE